MGGVCAGEHNVSTKDEVHVGSHSALEAREPSGFFTKVSEVANAIAEAAQEAIAEVSGTPHHGQSHSHSPKDGSFFSFNNNKEEGLDEEGQHAGGGGDRAWDRGPLVVDFRGPKGESKKVEFTVKKVGFSTGLRGGGCCGLAAGAKVVINELESTSPAAKAGCARGWEVKTINGVEVESVKQAEKLLKEILTKLPDSL